MLRKFAKVPKGWRRLRGTDIVRDTDSQWTKTTNQPLPDEGFQVGNESYTGRSVNDIESECEGNYGNHFYRKLNAP